MAYREERLSRGNTGKKKRKRKCRKMKIGEGQSNYRDTRESDEQCR